MMPLRMTFDGNISGVQRTDEKITRSPTKNVIKESSQLASGVRIIGGILVPAKPIEPDNCCLSGCVNCVWELYNNDLKIWREKRKEAASMLKGTNDVWPEDFNPPLKHLDLSNVPEKLKQQKMLLTQNKKLDMSSLFTKRNINLPESVIESRHKKNMKSDEKGHEEDEDNIPVFMKVFAEFEKGKLKKEKRHQI